MNARQTTKDFISGCRHFYWSEAIKPGRSQPTDSNTFSRIVALGRYLESVRIRLGDKPIYISSWYRDPLTNRNVGGSPKSRHLYGDAVDFYCKHMTIREVYDSLDAWHGSRGGLGLYKSHLHLDLRGYLARW